MWQDSSFPIKFKFTLILNEEFAKLSETQNSKFKLFQILLILGLVRLKFVLQIRRRFTK